ncbi:MAG: NAD kinase [Pelagibacteraceae bacterium]|jgi:NAD+ kinase|nr:NAD kinase [Candidatus Pelagibacter sp.]MDP6710343.1 NAD kinase [Pelagibacteraceae bacterium]
MISKKIHFAIDTNVKADTSQKALLKRYKNYLPNQSDVMVVIGGDGFMLKTLKKYQKYNKPFYGMNRGTFGFLMNKYKSKNIEKFISRAKTISISVLEMHANTINNVKKTAIAINEISLLRQGRQAASLQISNGKKIVIKKLISDGVLVSTPAGSTAYNLSVHGPILSLDSKKLAITPISPFRPRRWKGKIVPSSSLIKIKNLNKIKRPISVVADNVEVRNINNVKIRINNDMKFKLLYDPNNSLNKKIKLEQSMRR